MIVVDRQPRLEHKVVIHQESAVAIERMCTWCHGQFGKRFAAVESTNFGRDGTWQCTWDGHGPGPASYTFQFDHSEDAVVFALRWL
jgi:hypothetical protein